MKLQGTRGAIVTIELTRDELGRIADALDIEYDLAVDEERAEDALVYDQLAQAAYKVLGEVR